MKKRLRDSTAWAGTLAALAVIFTLLEYMVLALFFAPLSRLPKCGVSTGEVFTYLAKNALADFAFLGMVAGAATAAAAIKGRAAKRKGGGAAAFGAGVAAPALLYATAFVPVNVKYLPRFLSTVSIASNVALVVLCACVGYGVYRLARLWFRRAASAAGGRVVQGAALGLLVAAVVFVFAPRVHSSAEAAETPVGQPNVLILVFDALRADALSCYGSPWATPHFDDFAANGYRFENAFACAPNTWRSVPTIYTSQYPTVHGCTMTTASVPGWRPLAEVLAAEGYYCAAITGNEGMKPGQGFARGFDDYATVSELRTPELLDGTVFADLYRRGSDLLANFGAGARVTDLITAQTKGFISGYDRGRPFFLYVHYMDPHGVYTPPAEYVRGEGRVREEALELLAFKIGAVEEYGDVDAEVLRTLYLGEVAYVDAALSDILAALEQSGLGDETLVVITADHGEEFGEHGTVGGHYTHYREVIRVPLLVKAPSGPLAGAGTYEGAVSLADVAPTVYAAAAVASPPELEGVDLASLVADADPERFVYSEGSQCRDAPQALHSARFTVIEDRDRGTVEVYDREADPLERRNLYGAGSPLAEDLLVKLKKRSKAVAEKARRGGKAEEVELTAADRDTLRGLGYL